MYDARVHFQSLYQQTRAEFEFTGNTPADHQAWSAAFRPRLKQALGLNVIADQLAHHLPFAERKDCVDQGDYYRETWHLWVEPLAPLPFYLLRPKTEQIAYPLVLTPHGHNHPRIYAGLYENEAERLSMLEGERDIAVQAVREGYITIAPTTRGFGETRTAEDMAAGHVHSCRTELMQGLLVGRTPIGVRVWDMSRLIDWAIQNLPVDPARIAITGNSGGGTISLFAAACDERINLAMPGSYFCTFQGSIGSIHHCDCNYIPGMLNLAEMYDVAGLIAPRPFLAISGRLDQIFPTQHVQAAFARLQQIYAAAGVPERCELFIGEGGHRYYKTPAWAFLRKWFRQG